MLRKAVETDKEVRSLAPASPPSSLVPRLTYLTLAHAGRGRGVAAAEASARGGPAAVQGASLSSSPSFSSSSSSSSADIIPQCLSRPQTLLAETELTYKREHQLMLSAWHDLGVKAMRERVGDGAASSSLSGPAGPRMYQPQSWLSLQRAKANGKGPVRRCLSRFPLSPSLPRLTLLPRAQRNA